MPPKPLGDVAMSPAERQQRRRDKLAALRDAAPSGQANGSELEAAAAPPVPADYPRMLYHADGRTVIAATPEHHDSLTPDGWEIAPLVVHRQRLVSAYGVLGAVSDPLVESIRQVIRDEVRAVLRDELNQHDLSGAD